MYRTLFLIQSILVLIQIPVIYFFWDEFTYSRTPNSILIFTLSFILEYSYLYMACKILKETDEIFFININNEKFYILLLLIFVFSIPCIFYFLSHDITTLALKNGLDNVGIYYKAANVVIPALGFSLFFTSINYKIRYLILFFCFFVSALIGVNVLSKSPMIPYFIFMIFLPRKNIIKYMHLD